MSSRPRPPVLEPTGPTRAHKLDGARVEGRTIHLGRSRFIDTLVRTTFVDCTLRIHCGASALTIADCQFERCTFWPAKDMRNLRLESSVLTDCTFEGRYVGARFGRAVSGCDFSEARLFDLCEFDDGADIESCVFPGWPHVTILSPFTHRATLEALPVAADLALMLDVIAEPSDTAACTMHVPSYQPDAELVRACFADLPFVRESRPAPSEP